MRHNRTAREGMLGILLVRRTPTANCFKVLQALPCGLPALDLHQAAGNWPSMGAS